ncbi:hypothetical protein, conserved [Plasmodium gonderi]|uniref:Mitochondrial carrier protein n=1 Tax=Plasmodium gonderi TaxID=77519 RepID=A0A1Y1JG84_PLAGO|nr:hypothetical protein, conserved [Plasmodium gonderi]GAW79094.1 hypothetical protein, conserved [Plasmodium gonderi]
MVLLFFVRYFSFIFTKCGFGNARHMSSKIAIMESSIVQTFYGALIASTVSRILLYPLDTMKTNKQVHMGSYTGSFTKCTKICPSSNTAICRSIANVNETTCRIPNHGSSKPFKIRHNLFFLPSFIRKFGYKNLYSGFVFSSITTIPATSLYFCCFEYLKSIKINCNKKLENEKDPPPEQNANSMNSINYFSIAFLAEAISCILFVPIDIIKERLQAQRYLKLKEHKTSYHLLKDFIYKDGFFRLYRGYISTCLTYGIFGGSFFFLQNFGMDLMKKFEMESSNFNNLKLNLICSLLSGIITSPLEVVRIRFQLQEKNKTPFFYTNSVDGIKKLWAEESGKFFNLFKGNFYRCSLVCLSMAMNVTIIDLYKKLS